MRWPRRVSDEEIKTMEKEWMLSGGSVIRMTSLSWVHLDFTNGPSQWVCCYEKQSQGWEVYLKGQGAEVACAKSGTFPEGGRLRVVLNR